MGTERKTPKQQITIGNRDDDADLIDRILAYQKEKNFKYASEAVRKLCEDALAIKKAMK